VERDDDSSCRAIGVSDDETFFERRRVEKLLLGDYGEVEGVDEGYHEGYVGISTEVFGVGEDGDVG
jgi:hypothetical protein